MLGCRDCLERGDAKKRGAPANGVQCTRRSGEGKGLKGSYQGSNDSEWSAAVSGSGNFLENGDGNERVRWGAAVSEKLIRSRESSCLSFSHRVRDC